MNNFTLYQLLSGTRSKISSLILVHRGHVLCYDFRRHGLDLLTLQFRRTLGLRYRNLHHDSFYCGIWRLRWYAFDVSFPVMVSVTWACLLSPSVVWSFAYFLSFLVLLLHLFRSDIRSHIHNHCLHNQCLWSGSVAHDIRLRYNTYNLSLSLWINNFQVPHLLLRPSILRPQSRLRKRKQRPLRYRLPSTDKKFSDPSCRPSWQPLPPHPTAPSPSKPPRLHSSARVLPSAYAPLST